MILIFILILILIIISTSNILGSHEIKLLLPLVKINKYAPNFIEYKYPIYCIDSKPHLKTSLPYFDISMKNIFTDYTTIIRNARKYLFFSKRIYTELYSVLGFLNTIKDIKNHKIVVFEPKFGIISQIISKIYGADVYLFTIKPVVYILKTKINIIQRAPIQEDFKLFEGAILINLNILAPPKFSYLYLRDTIYAEYIYMEKLIKGFKPMASFHLCKSFHTFLEVSMPAGDIVIVPFTACSVAHSFGLICKGPRYEFKKIDLSNIWYKLVLFDLCIRNLNHGYYEYEIWDTWYAKKIIEESPKFDFKKYIGALPVIPKENTDYYLATNILNYTNGKYFLGGLIDEEFLYSNLTFKYINDLNINIKPQPIKINKVEDKYIFNFDLFESAINEIKYKLGFFMEYENEEFFHKIKYAGTVYTKFQPPKPKYSRTYNFIQVASYKEAKTHAEKNNIILISENYENNILVDVIENYLHQVKFPYIQNIWIMGEPYNSAVICAINRLFPHTAIHVIGPVEKIYTINYPATDIEFMFKKSEAGDLLYIY